MNIESTGVREKVIIALLNKKRGVEGTGMADIAWYAMHTPINTLQFVRRSQFTYTMGYVGKIDLATGMVFDAKELVDTIHMHAKPFPNDQEALLCNL